MKYLLVSDIHGSWLTLKKVLLHFDNMHCDILCILGDIINYGPRNGVPEGLNPKEIAEKLNAMADKIIAIRGNCDSEVDQMLLNFPIMQDYMLLVDEGHKLLLTHGHIYNKEHRPKGQFDAIIYGHTHLWELSCDAKGIVCNTGSITFPKGGNPPTFATYEHGLFTIFTLDGLPLKQSNIKEK
jgi:phosphodiesterase family protein